MDEGPDGRQRPTPKQQASDAEIGAGGAGVDEPDPLLEQGIRRHEQKGKDAAESHGDEPDDGARCQGGKIERAGGIPQKSEWPDQIQVAQSGGAFAETGYMMMGRQL